MSWVGHHRPIPGGATILGSGWVRELEIATQGEKKTRARAARVRGDAMLRVLPQLLREPAKGTVKMGVHRAPEQRGRLWRLLAASRADGHVCARDGLVKLPNRDGEGAGGQISWRTLQRHSVQ